MGDAGLLKHVSALCPWREQKVQVVGLRKGASLLFALWYVFVIKAIGFELGSELLTKGSWVLYLLSWLISFSHHAVKGRVSITDKRLLIELSLKPIDIMDLSSSSV